MTILIAVLVIALAALCLSVAVLLNSLMPKGESDSLMAKSAKRKYLLITWSDELAMELDIFLSTRKPWWRKIEYYRGAKDLKPFWTKTDSSSK